VRLAEPWSYDGHGWFTYSHHDHAGGNAEILKSYPLPIIGGKNCDKVNKTPAHGETFTIGDNIKVKALHTPCHTQDSICFLFEDGNDRAVFTGDTLFIGGNINRGPSISDKYWLNTGCGRFFEGNAEEMDKALNETLAALPDDTNVYVSEHDQSTVSTFTDPTTAWPRVHEGQRQIRHQSLAVGAREEAWGFRQWEQTDPGQIHDWWREGKLQQIEHEPGLWNSR
jgi:glyoxylase-like metal-dependent hydrolase (beta-lactamase superfamily II)